MTQEEHNLLIENNVLLKQILYLLIQNQNNTHAKDFIINYVANKVADIY